MNLNSAIKASASGLSAERFRMDVISTNIANANSVETLGQDPMRRKEVIMQGTSNGPRILGVQDDMNTPFKEVHQPGNPLRDKNDNVRGANIEPITEMVNMMSASRAYEANVAAFNTAKGMIKNALNIGKV